MAAPDAHKLLKEVETRLQAADGKLARVEGTIDKATRALQQATLDGAVAKIELEQDALGRCRPALNDGAHEAELAHTVYDRLRADRHAAEVHFKALEKLADRLDKLEKRYTDKIREIDNTLEKSRVELARMTFSHERIRLLQAALTDEVADLSKELDAKERTAATLKEQAERASGQRDAKALDRALQQVRQLGIDKLRDRLQRMSLRMFDLEGRTERQRNLPGDGDRDRLKRDYRQLEPRVDKLAAIEKDVAALEVRPIDPRQAARVLGLTDLKQIRQLEQALDGPDLAKALDPLARQHDASGKEWVKLLEKARVL